MHHHVIFLHALVMTLVFGVVLSADLPELSKGIKVGKLPPDSHLLETSITYDDRLYTTTLNQLLVLDKSTASIRFSKDLASGPGIDKSWDAITVGPCSADNDDKNCVYLGFIEKEWLRITKFEEPADIPPLGEYLSAHEEDMSAQLHLYSPFSLQLLVDQQAKIWIILRYEDSYFLSFLEDYEGAESGRRLSEMQKINFQQQIDIQSVSWDITESILVTSDEGFVYLFTNEGEISSPLDILTGKPHALHLHGGHRHKQTSVCWDQHTAAIYSMARGRHATVFRFDQAQSDENYSREKTTDCTDRNRYCSHWATNKMCEKRRDYMTRNCPVACNQCSENKRLKDMLSCIDKNQLCSVWAGQGKCKGESKEYMQQSCKKSCNLCLQSKSQCQDLSTSCQSWASIGRCDTRKVFMEENCAASCRLCKGVTDNSNLQNDQGSSVSAGTPASGCKDLSDYCSQWAEAKYCDSRKDYMFLNCPSSCGLCGAKQEQTQSKQEKRPKCADGSKYCMVWAANGLCEANKVYMKMNCKFACSFCARDSPPTAYGCEDVYDDCPTWAKYDLCRMNAGFMNERCRKSCGKCDKDEDNRIIQAASQRTPQLEYGALRETESCQDKSQHCEIWAKNDYCTTNSAHMNATCRKTCKLCRGASSEIVGSTTAKPTTERQREQQNAVKTIEDGADCEDDSEACAAWAEKGYCQTRSSVMNKYCPVTCGVCGQIAVSKTKTRKPTTRKPTTTTPKPVTQRSQLGHREECRDKDRMCPIWKEAGRCQSSKSLMSSICPFSCGHCSEDVQQSTCVDKNDYCATWASQGRKCQLYMGYMKANCAKSCRFCRMVSSDLPSEATEQTEECKNKRSHCESWASNDYCTIRKDFMNRYCKQSCGTC